MSTVRSLAMEEIYQSQNQSRRTAWKGSLREFKDSQEVELVIERVTPRDKDDCSEYTE